MKQRLRRRASDPARSLAQEIVLTLTAALGMVIFAGAGLMLVLGVKPLVFLSGSMEPAIATGALALTTTVPAGELREGDIISFLRSDGARVTHRIAELTPQGETFEVITRGDANETDDAEPLYITAADRVFWHLDGAGAVLTEATRFQYVFPFGVLVGMAALYGFRRMPAGIPQRDVAPEKPDDATAAAPAQRTGPALAVVGAGLPALGVITALALGAAGFGSPAPTLAAFTDAGDAAAPFAAYSDFSAPGPVEPETIACTSTTVDGSVNVTFTWSEPVGPATQYAVQLRLKSDPTLYTRETISGAERTATFTLPGAPEYHGLYRFSVTPAVDGAHPGATSYRTLDHQADYVACSWHDPAG